MNDFDLNLSERRVMASGTEIPVLITGHMAICGSEATI